MPRTRAQRRATEGLFALGDDALRNVLTLLSPSACALGPGATSKAMREVATSRQLQAARKSGSYVLRPPDNGVVHALATAMGTQQWATRSVRRHQLNREGSAGFANAAAVPPSRLRIIARRQANHATTENHEDDEEPYASFFASLMVGQSQSIRCDGGRECALGAGSYIGYELPFLLRLSHFRLSRLGDAATTPSTTGPSRRSTANGKSGGGSSRAKRIPGLICHTPQIGYPGP